MGGGHEDSGHSCAVVGNGNIYMVGWTTSTNAISDNGHQNAFGGGGGGFGFGGDGDAYMVKFDDSFTGIHVSTSMTGDLIWLGQEGTTHHFDVGESRLDRLELYTATGHLVFITSRITSGSRLLLDLAGIASGIYTVRFSTGSVGHQLRIVHQ